MADLQRKPLKLYRGVVTTRSGEKTVRVVMNHLQKHPKYGKIMRRRTVALVHDERNEARIGQVVDIAKCRPISKNKHWRLVRIVSDTAAAEAKV